MQEMQWTNIYPMGQTQNKLGNQYALAVVQFKSTHIFDNSLYSN